MSNFLCVVTPVVVELAAVCGVRVSQSEADAFLSYGNRRLDVLCSGSSHEIS